MTDAKWTFDQGRDVACITFRGVFDSGQPILLASHDADDHSWQFLTGEPISMDDAMVVAMGQMVDHDPTLLEIGIMPPGHIATRRFVGDDWQVEKDDSEEE